MSQEQAMANVPRLHSAGQDGWQGFLGRKAAEVIYIAARPVIS